MAGITYIADMSNVSGSQLRVLLFTDVAGSMDLKARLGAGAYAKYAAAHDAIFKSILAEVRGASIVNDLGDGFVASFDTASQAVQAALRFQLAIASHRWPSEPLRVRMGIHVGEVTTIGGQDEAQPKIVGLAADIAARVMSLALPGQILLTRTAFDDARQYVREHPLAGDGTVSGGNDLSLRWMAHGQYLFQGSEESLEVFEVGAKGLAPLKVPDDVEKARRSVRLDEEETLGWRPAIGMDIAGRPGWKLERKLGEGGFGEVWLGHHNRLHDRRVFKFCFDPDRLRSFRRELTLFRLLRETLGDRADIARLYEVQLETSPYFLESEYSEPGNLAEWAEKQGGLQTIPLEARIEIVRRVAEAVAAAHSVGVLHKDIKPSNILMYREDDGAYRPRIADFGIGLLADRRALEGRNITVGGFTVSQLTDHSSSRTGTRMYAPPESMLDQPFTTKGDVYALGVLLYQMTIGDLQRPLSHGWESDVDDAVLRGDIADCVSGYLELRLGNASELAERLRSLSQRRRAHRRRIVAKFSAAASIALLLLLIAAVGWLWRERDLRLRAERAEQTADSRRIESEKQAAIAQATSSFLNEIFDLANPGHGQGDRDMRVRQVLDAASERLERDLSDRSRTLPIARFPEVEAAVRQTLGMTYHGLGMYAEAESHLRRALEIREATFGREAAPSGETLAAIGGLQRDQGQLEAAEATIREGISILTKARGADHPDTIRARAQLGGVYFEAGKPAEAESLYAEILQDAKRTLGDDDPTTLTITMDLALAKVEQNKFAEAHEIYDGLIPAAERVYGVDHVETLTARNNLGVLYQYEGDFVNAEAVFTAVLEARQRRLGDDHPMTLATMNNLGTSKYRLGKVEECLATFEQAYALTKRKLGVEHVDTLRTMINLAQIRDELGKSADAEAMLREALETASRTLGQTHPIARTALGVLATACQRQKKNDEAVSLYQRVLDLESKIEGPEHPNALTAMNDLAGLYHDLKRYPEAEELYSKALDIRVRTLGEEHQDTLIMLNNMAALQRDMGNLERASEFMSRAIAGARKSMPAGHWIIGAFLTTQGKLQTRLGQHEQAEKSLLEAYRTMIEVFGADHQRTHDVESALHQLYLAWSKPDEAAKWQEAEPAAGR